MQILNLDEKAAVGWASEQERGKDLVQLVFEGEGVEGGFRLFLEGGLGAFYSQIFAF